MLDAPSSWLTVISTLLTLAIAVAVYRLQAHRLWLDMFDRRISALRQLQKATESRLERILVTAKAENLAHAHITLKETRRFLEAQREAAPLFGPEFNQVAKRLDETLRAYSNELEEVTKRGGGRDWQDVARLQLLTRNITGLQEQLATDARPYITVGTRGLGLAARARISAIAGWRAYRRRKGKWFSNLT